MSARLASNASSSIHPTPQWPKDTTVMASPNLSRISDEMTSKFDRASGPESRCWPTGPRPTDDHSWSSANSSTRQPVSRPTAAARSVNVDIGSSRGWLADSSAMPCQGIGRALGRVSSGSIVEGEGALGHPLHDLTHRDEELHPGRDPQVAVADIGVVVQQGAALVRDGASRPGDERAVLGHPRHGLIALRAADDVGDDASISKGEHWWFLP